MNYHKPKTVFWMFGIVVLIMGVLIHMGDNNKLYSQSNETFFSYDPDTMCMTAEEYKLTQIINQYRASKNLPRVPVSKALTYVAQIHVRDLEHHGPDQGRCNTHSWSNNGNWSGCCYTPDHAAARCMWDKPRELTNYPGNGYECGYWHSAAATAEGALNSWQNSSGHNAVITSAGMWASHPWKAMGVGIYGKYAVVWFGEESDSEGSPAVCSE